MARKTNIVLTPIVLGRWPDMVYLTTRGGGFLKPNVLQVSPLAIVALQSNSPLHMLPIQRHKLIMKRTEVSIHETYLDIPNGYFI